MSYRLSGDGLTITGFTGSPTTITNIPDTVTSLAQDSRDSRGRLE